MIPELIIDGYNLLHYAGLGNVRPRRGEFEQARRRLLARLKESLSPEELSRTTVVFDAQYAEHADRRPVLIHGMTILFSARGRQADDLIEDLLYACPQPEQIRLISSDHRLRQAARSVRAQHLDSDSFLVELESRIESRQRAARTPSALTEPPVPDQTASLSTEDWLQEFGEIDVAAIDREVGSEGTTPTPVPPPRPPVPKPSTSKALAAQPPAPPDAAVPQNPPLGQKEQASAVPPSELSFWEQRIADMLNEEPSSPPRPPRPPR